MNNFSHQQFSSDQTPVTKDTVHSAGEILKQARRKQGLSLDVVHEATKIPMDALKAIEEGYTTRIMSPFYYRGFIRMYASYLKVDVSSYLEGTIHVGEIPHVSSGSDFDETFWDNVKKFFTRQRIFMIGKWVGIIILVILFFRFFGGCQKKWAERRASRKETVSSPAPEVPAEEIKPRIRKPEEIRTSLKEESKKVSVPKAEAVKKTENVPSQGKSSSLKSETAAVSGSPVIRKNVSLTVRANESGWFLVKSDDAVVFRGNLSKGDVETWLADQKIEITGNISGLEYELNGKMIGRLGREDRKSKTVVVTSDGLTVLKKK